MVANPSIREGSSLAVPTAENEESTTMVELTKYYERVSKSYYDMKRKVSQIYDNNYLSKPRRAKH